MIFLPVLLFIWLGSMRIFDLKVGDFFTFYESDIMHISLGVDPYVDMRELLSFCGHKLELVYLDYWINDFPWFNHFRKGFVVIYDHTLGRELRIAGSFDFYVHLI